MSITSLTRDHTPVLGSLLLGSPDPTRLREWYQQALGATVDEFGSLRLGSFWLMPDGRDDVVAANPEPGRFVLNLDVDDAQAAVERIEAAGTNWIARLELREPGWFATFTDPDGNYIQVVQLTDEMRSQMLAQVRRDWRNTRPFCGFAVDDTAAAKDFYTKVLGLDVTEQHGLLAIWLDATTFVLAYPKPDHQPAAHTVLNFPVDDIEAAVDGLAEQGVEFQKYDFVDEKGINRQGGPLIAWFTDPAGNVLSVLQET